MTMKSQDTYIFLLQRVKISVTPLYRYKCFLNFSANSAFQILIPKIFLAHKLTDYESVIQASFLKRAIEND